MWAWMQFSRGFVIGIDDVASTSSSAFPSYISGVHHLGWDFFVCDCFFFNPTIEVVTFHLRGWCMLGVFFVASIHPSRTWTSESFEFVWWNACVHRLDLGLYSHLKEFLGTGVRTHANSKGKIPSTGKNFLRGGLNPWRCIKQDSEPTTLPTSYCGPSNDVWICVHLSAWLFIGFSKFLAGSGPCLSLWHVSG